MARTQEEQSKSARLARLKRRVQQLAQEQPNLIVASGILLGIIDLLEDEL